MSWYLDTDNRLNHADLAKEGNAGFVSPYPYTFWNYISDTDKTLTLNRDSADPPFTIMRYAIVDEEANRNDNQMLTYPYPASFWYLDSDNRLNNALLPEEPAEGSFMDCTTLEYVSIPESVQYIGRYAFTNTALTRVRISRTCTYYPTSFPAGCEIWYYDEEPEPADDFYSKAEIDAMMIRLGILGLELFKISDLETRKISILEGD